MTPDPGIPSLARVAENHALHLLARRYKGGRIKGDWPRYCDVGTENAIDLQWGT